MSQLQFLAAQAFVRGTVKREKGIDSTPESIKPLMPERVAREAKPDTRSEWVLACAPGVFGEGVQTVRANSKGEARAMFKAMFGLERIPVGWRIERLEAAE